MRRPNLLVTALATALLAACLVTGTERAARTPTKTAPAAEAIGGVSCKPRPPVIVEFVRGTAGNDQVVVEALETTPEVLVRIGSGDVGSGGRTLWSGGLTAGERRNFAVKLDSGAADAWATCDIASPAGTTLRSIAISPGTASRSRNTIAAETGRIVVDPNTGDGVFEYRGLVEASR